MRAPYPQPETRKRVLAAVRAGAVGARWAGDLPPYRTVLHWVRGDAEFAAALAEAQARARARAPKRMKGAAGAAWFARSRVTYVREAERGRVLEAVRAGALQKGWPADLPAYSTVWRWARSDEAFADALRTARRVGRAARWTGLLSQRAYSYDKRDAFLAAVRAGTPVRELTRRAFPGPDKPTLRAWLRQDGWFAEAFTQAKRVAAASRPGGGWPLMAFDQDVADAVIVALSKGVTLPEIWKTRGMPGRRAMEVWQEQEPEFADALAIAKRFCLSVRKRARRHTPAVERRVFNHILDGGTLSSAGALKGLPSASTLHLWKSRRPGFAETVRWAEKFRAERVNEQALELVLELGPGPAAPAAVMGGG